MISDTTRWVIQLNLGKDDDAQRMHAECRRLGLECELLKIIPFSETLPNVSNEGPTIFYGGTNWINSIHRSKLWVPGVWFDETAFLYSTSMQKYGEDLLNSSAEVMSLHEFPEWAAGRRADPDHQFFIRPLRDLKEFAGDVVRYSDFKDWADRISFGGYTITPNTQIIVGEPYRIRREWRCFVVDQRVIAASQYRADHCLDVTPGAPEEIVTFTEQMAKKWSPERAFVMDVGICGSRPYVIENNCINSAGFYATDIELIVKELSALAFDQWSDFPNTVAPQCELDAIVSEDE